MEIGTVSLPVRREDDDELIGVLLPSAETGGQWVPATVFGAALGPGTDQDAAEALVREIGMSSLAEPWWVRSAGQEWRRAWLLEVKSDAIRLRWENPMLMVGGHGEWVRLVDMAIQRQQP
ncbi:hypothetical protein [Lapillicoccus sp.]|uniref:hypothetical protein n=1 Tax=Lapillicoccus sp. TaxID=1909287 RepID=UPI0032671624